MKCRKSFRNRLANDDGTITIFSLYMVLIILITSGVAIDLMRQESARVSLQSAMDRAVISAADLDQMQDPSLVVEDYLDKVGLSNALSDVSIATALNSRTVSAQGAVELNTLFMRMSGVDKLSAPALSTADERIANVEISLVLDISGSMRHNDRMTKMKPAAQDFVSKVMSEESSGVTTLNLVPFAGHVNPGATLFDFFRGERPKLKKENNGWGNGDQDAPGGSLCNNNAENAEEGAADPSCSAGTEITETTSGSSTETTADSGTVAPAAPNYFTTWEQAISNVVLYFDTDGDDVYDRAHKIEGFPDGAPRDADDFFAGAAAYVMANDSEITSSDQFLGISIKGGKQTTRYFQVKGNQNGPDSDLGPTKNRGKIPGSTYYYGGIDFGSWATSFVDPNPQPDPNELEVVAGDDAIADEAASDVDSNQNVNMPSSCVEIYDHEFQTTELPTSEDYVPHFMFWDIEESVMEWGWCPGEDATIQYYSSDRQALIDYIGVMPMYDGTGLQYGMKYGLALLDPDNRNEVSYLISEGLVDTRFQGRPIDWHDQETEKYIVLMTDGQTTDQYRPNDPKAAINGEVELSNQGSYLTFSGKSTNVSNLLTQCELAKQQDVTVFTIAFETDAAATSDMRECASSVSHFFHVQGSEISDAFDMVARQINNLRLIQ